MFDRVIDYTQITSLNVVKTFLIFIHSKSNDEYYDSLDMLLDKEYLLYPLFLRTNRTELILMVPQILRYGLLTIHHCNGRKRLPFIENVMMMIV